MSKKEKRTVFFCAALAFFLLIGGFYIADKNTKQVSGYLDGQTIFKVEFGHNPSVTVFNEKFTLDADKAL